MKMIKKWYSFTSLCIILLVLYTFSLVIFRGISEYFDIQRMSNAFPSISNIIQYKDLLINDKYESLPMKQYANSSLIVFNGENGSQIYASNEKIAQNIYFDDLDFIGDVSSNSYYNLSKIQDSNNQTSYMITLENYNESENMSFISKYCILDNQYNIVEGDLFTEYGALDARQINLLQGYFEKKMNIEKYTYSNQDGEARELVFISPQISDKAYNALLKENQAYQIYALPIFIVIVIIQLAIFRFIIKRSFLPFQKAIIQCRNNTSTYFDDSLIPKELRQTVNEFKHTMQSLEQSKLETKKMNEEKYAMISGISHDLKTPLTVIQGFSKALLEHRVPTENQKRYLQTIYDRSLKACDLIDSLFNFTKIEHPDFQPQFRKVDVCEFTKQFFAMKYQEILDKGFCLKIDIPDDKYFSNLDQKLFERVLDNIIENSLKHNNKETTIYIQVKQEDGNNILVIADDGVGIDLETGKRIFIPFVTGDSSRNQKKGNGLGMAIVQKIVMLHHGDIQLKTFTSNNHSIEFTISIPIVD